MENCIFCKIVDGKIPSFTVYEDDNYKAMMDINPANLGHILVIPKNHHENIFDIEENTLCALFRVVKKVSCVLKSVLNCDGINIVQNNKEAAGQTVNHFHVHVIPRYKGDGLNLSWRAKAYDSEEINTIYEKIKSTSCSQK